MTSKQVVPFPQLKERLLKKLNLAIAEQDHEEIIYFCDELMACNYVEQHVFISKINALIALKQWEEAERLCELIMSESSETESFFMGYYMFILHEACQYVDLIETFESSMTKGVISHSDDVLVGLYESAKHELQIDNEHQKKFLMRAFNERNHMKQIQIISTLKRQHDTNLERLYQFLVDSKVHPVVKTEILLWAKELKKNKEVKLEKFGQILTVLPIELSSIEEQSYYQVVLESFNNLQQENPVQYEWLKSLIYHYYFIIYPFSIAESDIIYLKEALAYLSEYEFNLNNEMDDLNVNVKKYIEEIQTCHEMYLQIYGND